MPAHFHVGGSTLHLNLSVCLSVSLSDIQLGVCLVGIIVVIIMSHRENVRCLRGCAVNVPQNTPRLPRFRFFFFVAVVVGSYILYKYKLCKNRV